MYFRLFGALDADSPPEWTELELEATAEEVAASPLVLAAPGSATTPPPGVAAEAAVEAALRRAPAPAPAPDGWPKKLEERSAEPRLGCSVS